MKGQVVLFSNTSDDWGTPIDFFNALDKRFKFTLDPCATEVTAKCKKYYTKEQDGLVQSWEGERVFVNPPYSSIAAWLHKAHQEFYTGKVETIVFLIPSRTDTKWFHHYVYEQPDVRYEFIKGRLKFTGSDKGKSANSAPFPSMLVIFKKED